MVPQAPIKMRVICDSPKAKIQTYATAIGEAFKCKSDNFPLGYPCEKERLVIIVATLKGGPSDQLRRFCSDLSPARAANVAFVLDNASSKAGIEKLKEILREAGTNVIEEPYYVKAGIFSGEKITLDERIKIVKWAESVAVSLTN